jgi:PAS domain S-box-containing protein
VRAALNGLYPSLEAYIQQAEALGTLAAQDRSIAMNRLPQLERSFEALDHQQDLVSELVIAKEARAERESARTAGLSNFIVLCFTLLSLAGFGIVSWLLSRRLSLPLSAGMQTILAKSNIIAMFVGDHAGTIRDANDKYLEYLGHTRAELAAGKVRWKKTFAPEYHYLIPQFQQQLDSEGITVPAEVEYVHTAGHRIPTLLGMATLDPAECTVIGFAVDLSERKRSEESLRKSEQRLRTLVDSLDDVVIEMDEHGTFLDVWARSDDLLPLPKAEMIGQNIAILGNAITGNYLDKLGAAFETGRPQELEYSFKRSKDPDGFLRWVKVRFHSIRSGDAASKTACLVISEITARKQAQEDLRKAKEAAESANVAKSEFLANMSHEIRTPMNGILGILELMLDTSLNTEQRELLDTAKLSADSLLRLLSDILDISKVEARELDLNPEEFRVREMVDSACLMLMSHAREKGLKLIYQVEDAVPDVLVGDKLRLRQVLLNLVGNAVKFTGHGEVEVDVALESRANNGSVKLHFVVRDTGIGIAPEKQNLVFVAFAQADGSITRRFGGTGLGLTISSRLVEMMGGRMWVESLPGEGSRFHFTAILSMPSTKTSQIRRATLTTPPKGTHDNDLRKLRILLAEDNPVNQKVAVRILQKLGHRVEVASSGREALSALERGSFDMVLMDVQMPDMSGLEATAAIRYKEKESGEHLPIIALTAGAMHGDREKCIAAGMDDYIAKPFSSEVLKSILEAHETNGGSGNQEVVR